MRALLSASLALLLLVPAARALDDSRDKPKDQPDKPATPAEQYKALQAEFNKSMQDFQKVYSEAKTDEERQKAFSEKYPNPQKFAGRFLELAQKNPKDPTALQALIWVAPRAQGTTEYDTALGILAKDYTTDPQIAKVVQTLMYADSPEAEQLMRTVLEKNKDKEAQGWAAFCLASYLNRHAQGRAANKEVAAKNQKEAEELFERVAKEYGDIKVYGNSTLSDQAKGSLFEIRNLALGKPVPEIEGEDLDGKKFKLSDYKGKVVVLDFWGNW